MLLVMMAPIPLACINVLRAHPTKLRSRHMPFTTSRHPVMRCLGDMLRQVAGALANTYGLASVTLAGTVSRPGSLQVTRRGYSHLPRASLAAPSQL